MSNSSSSRSSLPVAVVRSLWGGAVFCALLFWRWPVLSTVALFIGAVGVSAMYGDQYIVAACAYFICVTLLTARTIAESRARKEKAATAITIVLVGTLVLGVSLWLVKYTYEQKTKNQANLISIATAWIWPNLTVVAGRVPWRWVFPAVAAGFVFAALINVLRERQQQSKLQKKSVIGLVAQGAAEPNKPVTSLLQCVAIRHDKVSVGRKGGWVRSGANPVDAFTLTIRSTSEHTLYPLVARIAFYGTDGQFCHQVNNAEWLEAGKSRRVILGAGEIKEILLLWKLTEKDVYASGDTNRADLCSCGDTIRVVVAFVTGNEETFIQQLQFQITLNPLTVKPLLESPPKHAAHNERVEQLLEHDKESIERLVRIPWIIYQPHFDGKEPYIDLAVGVFNNSLYDIVIDNSIKGDIWCDTSGDPFHYEPKIYPTRPIECRSRRGASFVIRHPLTVGEVSRFEGRDDALIWFDCLEITFSVAGDLPEIDATMLNTKGFCLETKKGAYRNPNDKDEFAFLYSDEQWALLSARRSDKTAGELEQKLRVTQDRLDGSKWVLDIAEEQAKSIQDNLDIDCHVDSHKLVGDDQYIDFTFSVTNRNVYKITLLDQLSGSLHFGQRRLAKAPVLSENSVKNLALNKTKWFTISQPLTSSEAAEVLTDVPGQFGLYGLHTKIAGSPNLTEPVDFKWLGMTGPIVSKEFIASNYPKVGMKIDASNLNTYFRYRKSQETGTELPSKRLGTVVNLKVLLKNPRPLKVRHFKLVTSGPVVMAELGEIRDSPHVDSSGHPVSSGRALYPNLADQVIDVDRDNVIEGWLQFIVKEVAPEAMLRPFDFVVRLHVVDKSGEEHRQDVEGLKFDPSRGPIAG